MTGFVFCFACCLDEVSITGCYWWLGDARPCIQVVFLHVSSHYLISLRLVLWLSMFLESVLPLQRLRAWSQALCGSIYSFLLIRYSCLLSAGVLHALLCLKVYSWCIHEVRCTPCPPTPPTSCSLNWYFWTVVLEKTLESPLDFKKIRLVNPKGNQSWIFIGRTNTEAETQILWPPDVKNFSFEKTLMLGKIEGRRKRGWQRLRWLDGHHQLNGHESEQTLGDSKGQRSLTCCSPCKESDITGQLNNNINYLVAWGRALFSFT